jgi:neutral ceramidase
MTRAFVVTVLACAVLSSCSKKLRVPAYTLRPAPAPKQLFLFGRGKTDITPPPGFAMGGHSLEGAVARGYWTRLYARAFYFEDGAGRLLVLVSCDTFAIPAGLTAKVLQLVNTEMGSFRLAAESLVLHATHTHQGAGNYMTSPVYNTFSGALPGFSASMLDFLALRVSDAIRLAREDAERSAGERHHLLLRRGSAPDLQRNRAVPAFLLNPEREQQEILRRSEMQGQSCADGAADCVRYRAVDPTLTVLEVQRESDTGPRRPVALLTFYAAHPTALSHDAGLYSSDVSGVAMRLLEQKSQESLVAGFFNGAEGDVSVQWRDRNREDALRIGGALAARIAELRGAPPAAERTPGADFRICTAQEQFRAFPATGPTTGLAPPEFGAATVGGAEDGRSAFYHSLWHGGVKDPMDTSAQAPKVPALSLSHLPWSVRTVLSLLSGPGDFPRRLPVSVVRLGDLFSLAALPFEITTVAGQNLLSGLAPAGAPAPVLLVGLANEYLSYLVTPEEYLAQEYEGSSTVFGRYQQTVVAHLLDLVNKRAAACAAAASIPVRVPEEKFHLGLGPIVKPGPHLFDERRNVVEEGLEPFTFDRTGRLRLDFPRFEWDECSSCRDGLGDFEAQQRKVEIYAQAQDGWGLHHRDAVPEDDGGFHLLTILTEARGSLRNWTALWLAPDGSADGKQYMFRVKLADGEERCSAAFQIDPPSGRPATPIPPAACPPLPAAQGLPNRP